MGITVAYRRMGHMSNLSHETYRYLRPGNRVKVPSLSGTPGVSGTAAARCSAGASNQARLPDGAANWTYAAAWTAPLGIDDMPGQPAPSRGESLWAHAEGSISEDVILAGARERKSAIAGAVTPAVGCCCACWLSEARRRPKWVPGPASAACIVVGHAR